MGRMDEKFEESVMKLAGLVVSLQSRTQSLERLVLALGRDQGFDPEKMQAFLDEDAKARDEKLLLEVGDQDPRGASIADVLGRLKDEKEDEGGS